MIPRSYARIVRATDAGSRTEPKPQLSDEQWFLIEDLFPDPVMSSAGGRPPHPNRACFEGILFVLFSGCRWKDLPGDFPSKSVCHQRFKLWVQQGLFPIAWQRLLQLKHELRQLDLTTLIGDGTFVPAKKGGAALARRKSEKVRRSCC